MPAASSKIHLQCMHEGLRTTCTYLGTYDGSKPLGMEGSTIVGSVGTYLVLQWGQPSDM